MVLDAPAVRSKSARVDTSKKLPLNAKACRQHIEVFAVGWSKGDFRGVGIRRMLRCRAFLRNTSRGTTSSYSIDLYCIVITSPLCIIMMYYLELSCKSVFRKGAHSLQTKLRFLHQQIEIACVYTVFIPISLGVLACMSGVDDQP